MELKNIFEMTKADRYTQDGRDQIAKLQETQDKVYQIGEISQKTGLQKTANGWRPPQETKFGKVKQNKEGQWGVQVKQGKGSDFLKHKSEAEAKRALSNYTAGYNTTERSKEDPHSDKARQAKQWRKEDEKAAKARRAEGRAAHAAQFKNAIKPGSDDYIAQQKALEQEGLESTPAEEQTKVEPKHTLEVGSEVKFKRSGQPITIKKIENYGGTPIVVGEFDNNGKRETNRFRLDELDYEQKEERKDLVSGNSLEEGRTVNFKKTGQPIKIKKVEYYGSTPIIVGEYEHNGKTETNRFRMDEIETPDSAPRVLTGDCKIRVRKA